MAAVGAGQADGAAAPPCQEGGLLVLVRVDVAGEGAAAGRGGALVVVGVMVVVVVSAGAPPGVEGVVVGALGYQDEVGEAEVDR